MTTDKSGTAGTAYTCIRCGLVIVEGGTFTAAGMVCAACIAPAAPFHSTPTFTYNLPALSFREQAAIAIAAHLTGVTDSDGHPLWLPVNVAHLAREYAGALEAELAKRRGT